jgi:hypothetical protein
LGGLQNSENQEDLSDIEKREGSGDSKSQTPLARGGGNKKNRKDSRRPSHPFAQKATELDLEAMSECLGTEI